MPITLDGNEYDVLGTNVGEPQRHFRNDARGLTGAPIFLTTGLLARNPTFTLVCTLAQLATLKASFIKTTLLNFTGEDGVSYLAGAGADDATHKYSTGVAFSKDMPLDPKPMSPAYGWASGNRFTVQVQLVINSTA